MPDLKAFHPVRIPGSKSVSNRALILAALADGESRLSGGLDADDTVRMRGCLQTLGIELQTNSGTWIVRGGTAPRASRPLDVGASGTTLRFLLPWLAVNTEEPVHFHGDPRLFERPLGGLLAALESMGASWEPLVAGGILHPVTQRRSRLDVQIDSSASSQFLTGLAMAAASLPEGGRLLWKQPSPSTSYLDLTAHWMEEFGCPTHLTAEEWTIPGRCLKPTRTTIPADWSGAAAFLCAGAVTGNAVTAHPLDPADPQGDRAILTILASAGCAVEWADEQAIRVQGPLTKGLRADLEQCPDLGPVLAATAALAPEPSVLTGLHTLPLKECDRLDASAELVRWLGGSAQIVDGRTLNIFPGPPAGIRPPFDPRNDHRMAFAAAVGMLRCGGSLLNPDCVAKTFPTFWKDWNAMLGITA